MTGLPEPPQGEVITIQGGRIVSVANDASVSDMIAPVLELPDSIVTPGFIDVHVHGGGGFNLHTTDPDEICAYARWAPSGGTTAFLIGTVGVAGGLPVEQLRAAVTAIEMDSGEPSGSAEALGIHLEGPYINVVRRGAHDPAWLRTPDDGEITQILALTRGHLRLITVAPELPGAASMVSRLVEAGVAVSIGHTNATYE